jgi:hypothetical protein
VITTETEAECQGSLGMQAFKSGVIENQCTAEQVAFRPSLAEQRYEGRSSLGASIDSRSEREPTGGYVPISRYGSR